MSQDYHVFLKDAEKISASEFECYAYRLGYQIRMYPLENCMTHSGFLPFNLRADFMGQPLPYDSLLSGFEIYFSEYDIKDYDEAFDRQVGSPQQVALLSISGMDSFEGLIALIFAGYLCRYCGGVFYDPQTDTVISDTVALEAEIKAFEEELKNPAYRDFLQIHEFNGWH